MMKNCIHCQRELDEKSTKCFCEDCQKITRLCQVCGNECPQKKAAKYCSDECKIKGNVIIQENGCWEWQSDYYTHGYGRTQSYDKKIGVISSHKLSYKVYKGEVPDGMFVCHSCDNKKCCSPDHLYLGDQKKNIQDATSKKRMKNLFENGEKHWAAKVTESQVIEIRRLYKNGERVRRIAEKFN
ncbi:MAG TPA: hypothetical protein DCP92_24655, partial [Nitrospiraceae bacterium]|nr:hypothetical protein [Nitrospiraceae bacterium]